MLDEKPVIGRRDQDEAQMTQMTSPDYSENRRISLDMTPLSCKSTDSSAECAQFFFRWWAMVAPKPEISASTVVVAVEL